MRITSIVAFAVTLFAGALSAPHTAEAGGRLLHRHHHPDGWNRARVVRHWVYRPRYVHYYITHAETDPYAYRYEPRGYYPYYNSEYWVPRCCYQRPSYPYRIPTYYKGWGSHKKGYHHHKWHSRHHGRHRHHHW